jgi:hypothetical protein
MNALSATNLDGFKPSVNGASDAMKEANKAIKKWDLEELGWRGFEKLDWVEDITNKYPELSNIAHTCSSTRPGFLEQVNDLFDGMPKADRKEAHKFFTCKLGLEELSCRRSGPMGGGMCDKKNAFLQICQLTKQLSSSK